MKMSCDHSRLSLSPIPAPSKHSRWQAPLNGTSHGHLKDDSQITHGLIATA